MKGTLALSYPVESRTLATNRDVPASDGHNTCSSPLSGFHLALDQRCTRRTAAHVDAQIHRKSDLRHALIRNQARLRIIVHVKLEIPRSCLPICFLGQEGHFVAACVIQRHVRVLNSHAVQVHAHIAGRCTADYGNVYFKRLANITFHASSQRNSQGRIDHDRNRLASPSPPTLQSACLRK